MMDALGGSDESNGGGGVVKIAIVDASVHVQQSLGRLLGAIDGVEVVGCAQDVAGAHSLVDSKRPDVVVLDVHLREAYLKAGANAFFDKSMEYLQAHDWIAGQVSECVRR